MRSVQHRKPYAYLRSCALMTCHDDHMVHHEGRFRLTMVGLDPALAVRHEQELATRFEACVRGWLAEQGLEISEGVRAFETTLGVQPFGEIDATV